MKPDVLPGGRLGAKEHEVTMKIDTPQDDRFLREPEVARLTGLSRTTRWRLERDGKFPKRIKISESAKANLHSQIMAWMAERVDQAAA